MSLVANTGPLAPPAPALRSGVFKRSVLLTVLFYAFVLLASIGTTPFNDAVRVDLRSQGAGGSLVRQVFIIFTFGILLTTLKRSGANLSRLITPLQILLLAWIFASIVWSVAPAVTFKRAILTGLTLSCVALFWANMGSQELLRKLSVLLAALCIVSFFSGFVIPNAIHQPGSPVEVVGAWRGAFPHKNNAGFATMIAIALALYQYRRTGRKKWLLVFAIETVFLVLTESKTSMGLTAFVLLMYAAIGLMSRTRAFTATLIILFLYVALNFALFGIIFATEIADFFRDPSNLTNRVYIWQLVASVWSSAPLQGVGFGALWEVGGRQNQLVPLLAGDRLAANQGHNGYLDLMATIGFVGLLLSVATLIFSPLFALIRGFRNGEHRGIVTVVFCLFVMMIFYNFMESYLLRNFQATWLIFSILYVIALDLGRPRPTFTTDVQK